MGRSKSKAKRYKQAKRKTGRAAIKPKALGHSGKRKRLALRGRPTAPHPRKAARTPRPLRPNPLIEVAVREMNRGRSLTAAARSLKLRPKELQRTLSQQRLAKRKGRRWVIKDNRLRRLPVMTGGRVLKLTVRGYEPARLVGEHHNAAGDFVRTNDIKLIKPFVDRTVQAVNGRRYVLETDPNALHRIAAMDSPPFHEIYEITSNT